MRYLMIDGYIHSTGIRDKYTGEYINLECLELDPLLKCSIEEWQQDYEKAFMLNDTDKMRILDNEGIIISQQVQKELGCSAKVEYYSNVTMSSILI